MHIVIFGVSFKHLKLKLRYTFLGEDNDFPWKKAIFKIIFGRFIFKIIFGRL